MKSDMKREMKREMKRDRPDSTGKSQHVGQSMGHALAGITATFKTERNFKIQLVCGVLAVIACALLQVPAWQWGLALVAIFFVLVAELFNTAIEAVTDLACNQQWHPLAKKAKDAAAGAVLLASVFALATAAIISAWALA